MTQAPRFLVVHPIEKSDHDSALLNSVLAELDNPATKVALQVLIAGMESGGAVVSKLNALVTPQEAAEFLGVSRQYVDKLLADGRIKFEYKPASKHRVIRVADLVALEQSRREGISRIGKAINDLIDSGAEY